jgi:hypothetical protein
MASAVDGLDFTRSIDRLDAGSSSNWTAVVHADGSGMGQLFLAFDQHLRAIGRSIGDLDDASAAYSELSMAIEQCTNAAWQDAARSVGRATDRRRDQADVVPVLLGGDDITVVIDGALALDFAEEYLRAFTRETGNSAALKGLGVGPLSAGAAVVWTKPGFPFSISYQLAEHRLSEAKRVAKSKGSAGTAPAVIDVAVVYDTSLDDVDHRAADNLDIRLTANPYAIDRHEGLASLSELKALIKELASNALPSSQVHELRSLLSTLGIAAAQRRLDELRTSHPALFEAVHPLVHDNGVMLLDALDIADAAGRSDGEDL